MVIAFVILVALIIVVVYLQKNKEPKKPINNKPEESGYATNSTCRLYTISGKNGSFDYIACNGKLERSEYPITVCAKKGSVTLYGDFKITADSTECN